MKVNYENMKKSINDKTFVFGHGFVIASRLLNINVWDE
jgi:hypothetical protein